MKTKHASGLLALLAALALVVSGLAQTPPTPAPGATFQTLPAMAPELTVEVEAEANIRIGIPDFLGRTPENAAAAGVLRDDLLNIGLFQVLARGQFPLGFEAEGLGIRRTAWTSAGADAVVKAEVRGTAPNVEVEFRLYEVGRVGTDQPTLTRTYRGPDADLRRFVHLFANDLVGQLTGVPGVFDTQIVFARRIATGRKHLFESDYDGANLRLLIGGDQVSMFPSYGEGVIWFTRLTELGTFITHTEASDRPVIASPTGMNTNPVLCNGRIFFASSRDGNADIYSARPDGSDVRRLTTDPAIDVTPSCGPNGMLAFVSSRQGTPQIWTMAQDGQNQTRITYRGDYNQTPSWCQVQGKNVIAFTGRDQSLDIFTVNVDTHVYVRLTQAQGVNKDPTWSPDCRMLAFHSSRAGGGIYVTNPSGFNQRRVLDGHAETIRWSPRTPTAAPPATPAAPTR